MNWRVYFLYSTHGLNKKCYKATNKYGVQVETGDFQRPKKWWISVAMGYRKVGWLRIMFRIVPFVPHRIVAVIDLLPLFVLSFASNKLLMLVFASTCIVLEHQENDLQRNFMEIQFVFTPRINNQMDLDFWINGSVSKPCTPVVHIKIAGKWMFIPLKMVLIGIDPYPNCCTGVVFFRGTLMSSLPEMKYAKPGICSKSTQTWCLSIYNMFCFFENLANIKYVR